METQPEQQLNWDDKFHLIAGRLMCFTDAADNISVAHIHKKDQQAICVTYNNVMIGMVADASHNQFICEVNLVNSTITCKYNEAHATAFKRLCREYTSDKDTLSNIVRSCAGDVTLVFDTSRDTIQVPVGYIPC